MADFNQLTSITSGQADKEEAANLMAWINNTLANQAVEDIETTPPGTPSKADAYIVGAGASGAWSGQDGNIAFYDGSSWRFVAPYEGLLIYIRDAAYDAYYSYDGSAWGAYTAEDSGFTGSGSELTISSGSVTVSGAAAFRRHTIDTEADAASDDLDSVSGGNAYEVLRISPANDARTVVVKHDGVNLILAGGMDFTMNSIDDIITLECKSSGVWREVSRSNNGS